jgi:Ca-activated chloride channel homolog
VRHVLRRRVSGLHPGVLSRLRPFARALALLGFVSAAGSGLTGQGQQNQTPPPATPPRGEAAANPDAASLAIQITSPLGRTGITGAIRIVARVTDAPKATLSPVQFFVDGMLVGEAKDGPPWAVEWTDANPYESTQITVQVADSLGRTAKDVVTLKPLEVRQESRVSSVLLEPLVLDAKGRPVNGLVASEFRLTEDGVPQSLDLAVPDTVPTTYSLLIDTSGSMRRRMEFVEEAASEMPRYMRPNDQVVVAPFSKTLGTVTGPTKDPKTIADAIARIQAGGGTSILDCLAALAGELKAIKTRQIIVLITDGYDENSTLSFDKALAAVEASQASVYVIAIGGVAGISLKGEDLLHQIATATGGSAFFPARDDQLPEIHARIASDVQERYLLAYTPTNQDPDGKWRAIALKTTNPTYTVRTRAGYYAPAPPPIEPQIELSIRDVNYQYLDIAPEDLKVVEDGVEQKIQGFEEALAPVSIVMALDASGSMKKNTDQVIAAARSFVDALPPKDSLGVLQFADSVEFPQDLSKNREASLDTISHYQANGGTALYDALLLALSRLKNVDGRRVVVVLTDGRDENNPGTGPGSTHTLDDVLERVKQVGATVFCIGLGTQVDQAVLEQLAELSGGEAYFPEDVSTLAANYRRVLDNLQRRFIITYTSTNSTHDGKWRKVVITCNRPGVVVESKGGYFAPEPVGASGAGGGGER